HRHLVGPGVGQFHVVGREHQRRARIVQLLQGPEQMGDSMGVETGGGLVQHQDFRTHRQYSSDGRPFFLAEAQRVRGALGQGNDSQRFQRLADPRLGIRLRQTQIQRPE
ncbi:hypothetical protein RZS08_39200, partial [Arthrospira platensis SPKY1]|nr:hypothetical protein [Arthrospira platensis SPKY1]